jgi:hypothetical protein
MRRRILAVLLLAVPLVAACGSESSEDEAAGVVRRACRGFEEIRRKAELLADDAQATEPQAISPQPADAWSDTFQAELERDARSAKLAALQDGKWMPVAHALENAAKASDENKPWTGADNDRRLAQIAALRNAHAACVGR